MPFPLTPNYLAELGKFWPNFRNFDNILRKWNLKFDSSLMMVTQLRQSWQVYYKAVVCWRGDVDELMSGAADEDERSPVCSGQVPGPLSGALRTVRVRSYSMGTNGKRAPAQHQLILCAVSLASSSSVCPVTVCSAGRGSESWASPLAPVHYSHTPR